MQQDAIKATRLEHLPISFFAMVMGLAGMTIAWEKAQHLVGMDLHINGILVGITSAVFAALVLFYVSKTVRYRAAIAKELQHPIKLNFFPTISI